MRQRQIILFVGLIAATPRFAVGQFFELVDLGTLDPPYTHTIAWDVNDSGVVCGEARLSWTSTNSRPFEYQNGRMSELPLPSDFEMGGAFAINNTNVFVGFGVGPSTTDHALKWEAGTVLDLHEQIRGNISWAVDVNDAGDVLAIRFFGKTQGVLLRRGVVVELGLFPFGTALVPTGLNNLGYATGSGNCLKEPWRAFNWDGEQLTPLKDVAGYVTSRGTSINDLEEIAGFATLSSRDVHSAGRAKASNCFHPCRNFPIPKHTTSITQGGLWEAQGCIRSDSRLVPSGRLFGLTISPLT